MGCLVLRIEPSITHLNLIRRQKRHCVGFRHANRQSFRGATATVLDAAANGGKLVGCRQLSGSQSPRKAEARRGAGLASGRNRGNSVWQTELPRQSHWQSSGEFPLTGKVCAKRGRKGPPLLQFVPRHLRPRREKIFGPAPSHHLDGNAKARVWAAAGAYNSAKVVSGKFSKSRRRGWSWYAGDLPITGSFGEDAHHDQETR